MDANAEPRPRLPLVDSLLGAEGALRLDLRTLEDEAGFLAQLPELDRHHGD